MLQKTPLNIKINLLFLFSLLLVNISAQKQIKSDTIALTINEYNTIFVKAVFNKVVTLKLNFNTGTTELILTNEVLKNKLKSSPKLYNTFYDLQIGNTNYKSRVYDAQLTGHGTDGRFSWDLFREKIV